MLNRFDEVFHFNGDKLTSMPFRSMRAGLLGKTLEDALQTFFEKYPQIIPGKQIDPVSEDPPHFVLLRREMPVGGWSLDHLFVDQKGSGGNVKWTIDKLRETYGKDKLGRRLQEILNWAVDKKCFRVAIAIKPTFGLQGKSKSRIVSFMSNGVIYSVINERHYPRGVAERDELVSELKKLQVLDQELDPQEVVSGRNLTKKLSELSDEELVKLLDIFSKYCI